jgi:glycosyltransferase involved in cell wall biosynthesis
VDDTAALVSPYLGVDDLLIIESDRGIYDAMNRALKLAKGDWVIFMGADDTLLMFTLCSELSDLAQSVKVVVGDSL